MSIRKRISQSRADAAATRRVVATARRQFLSQGFRRVTMDELADELGMSKKTLYGLFASKTALVEAVILDKFRCVESDLRRITAASRGDVLGALRRLVAAVQSHTQEDIMKADRSAAMTAVRTFCTVAALVGLWTGLHACTPPDRPLVQGYVEGDSSMWRPPMRVPWNP
jgi:AcrR family transcriptional regulator